MDGVKICLRRNFVKGDRGIFIEKRGFEDEMREYEYFSKWQIVMKRSSSFTESSPFPSKRAIRLMIQECYFLTVLFQQKAVYIDFRLIVSMKILFNIILFYPYGIIFLSIKLQFEK